MSSLLNRSTLSLLLFILLSTSVAYGSNPGSIGALFKYNEPSYANVWIYPGDNIQDNTIDSSELEANSVGASELADNSVGTDNVIDNSLGATDLAPNSIGNSELSNTENLTINNIHRSGHNTGHLVGSYNSVGSNTVMSNPIYSIGSSYMPGTNVLNDFYGIGYSHTNATFIPAEVPVGWGQYIASDGDVRHFLNGSNGAYWNTGGIKVDNRTIVGSDGWTEGDSIRQNSIDSSEIQDNTLTASDLAANSVGNSELVNDITVDYLRGLNYIYGDRGTIARSTDEWLRLNDGNSHTSGIYTQGLFRADAGFQVDGITVIGADAWIEGDRIRQNTIDSSEIQNNTLTASDLAANSVGSSELNNWAIFSVGGINVSGSATAGAFYYSSDRRLKKNISPLVSSLDIIKNIKGVKFNWKQTEEKDIGFIAQDVEKIVPELVKTNENGMKAVKYGNITAILVEAMKEQQLQIVELQKEIELLKSDK